MNVTLDITSDSPAPSSFDVEVKYYGTNGSYETKSTYFTSGGSISFMTGNASHTPRIRLKSHSALQHIRIIQYNALFPVHSCKVTSPSFGQPHGHNTYYDFASR